MLSNLKYKKFVLKRRFGVEIETSNTFTKNKVKTILSGLSCRDSFITKYQLSGDSDSWHIKDDATCGPEGREGPKGVEIASFVGKNITDLRHISDTAAGLYKAGSRVNENCGLHVHAEARDLTIDQVATLVAYWLKIEPIISASMPSHRRDNSYCEMLCKKFSNKDFLNLLLKNKTKKEEVWQFFRPEDLNYYENKDRRLTLNLVNYARAIQNSSLHRKTLELRWPEGTLNKSDIHCWVIFFLNFIETCKNIPLPQNLQSANLEDTLTYLGLNHDKHFFYIFSEDLHNTKTWFLERLIKNGEDKLVKNKAKKILNAMWFPIRNYI